MERKNLRALITGITGFAGGHLKEFLRKKYIDVFGIADPKFPSDKKGIYVLDIRKFKSLKAIIKDLKPDLVFHFAAISNVSKSWLNKRLTFQTNFFGTLNLLEAIKHTSPDSKILLVGSAEMYGNVPQVKQPINEKFPINPVNPYATSKAAQELLGKLYLNGEGLNVYFVRSFNYTGPGQSENFVCSDLARQIIFIEKGLSPPVIKTGNLEIKRDFSDVRDVIKAYYLILTKGKRGEIYQTCSGKTYRIREILEILLSYTDKKIRIIEDTKKKRKHDIPVLHGDFNKLRKDTGWKPEIPIEKTLLDLINWWRVIV
ncbi:MAG: GDP-mannose 4,6-dehydratase [Acidobacteriota bacterium]